MNTIKLWVDMNDKKTISSNEILLILFECFLAVCAFFISNNTIKIAIFVFIFYSTWFLKRLNPTLILFTILPTMNFEAGWLPTILISLPAYINTYTFRGKNKKEDVALFVLLIITVSISFVGGINSQMSTLIWFIRCIIAFITVSRSNATEDRFRIYAYSQFLVIVSILLIQLLDGSLSLYWGRLALNGNVRDLANYIAVPTFMAAMSLLVKGKRNRKLLVDFAILCICIFIALATSSRGVLLSVFVAVLAYYLFSERGHSYKKVLTVSVIALLTVFLANCVSSLGYFNTERILVDENGGFNGRTEIWGDYLDYEFSNFNTALFGFGPGEIAKMDMNGHYSHSLFMDWLFSYGSVGMFVLAIILIRIIHLLLSSKSKFRLSLFLLSCFLFSTHGVITNDMFYILVGVSYCGLGMNDGLLVKKEKRENETTLKEKKICAQFCI